jgi:hypothetical protein
MAIGLFLIGHKLEGNKSNDFDHNFQIFKIKKRNAGPALTELDGIKRV